MVVSRRRGPAASPAAQASRQPTRGAATAAKRKIEEGEAAAYEHSSDEDYDSLLESESEDESTPDGILRGRARLHCVQPSSAGEDNERRKSMMEKRWARRSVVVHGVSASGADALEEVPGREEFEDGDAGEAEWEAKMLEYASTKFNDAGTEVRSLDQRDCKVGLLGDFLERVGHGKKEKERGVWR